MKQLYTATCLLLLLLSGCESGEEESENTTTTKGSHFQGRDCVACHNVDLGEDKNLLVSGTLFKNSNVADIDDISESCGAAIITEFINSSGSVEFSSRYFEDSSSKGYDGKGNLFILSRKLASISGEYIIALRDKNSNDLLAQSSAIHSFNGADYDINNASDNANRRSCNACHNGQIQQRLFVQTNQQRCN